MFLKHTFIIYCSLIVSGVCHAQSTPAPQEALSSKETTQSTSTADAPAQTAKPLVDVVTETKPADTKSIDTTVASVQTNKVYSDRIKLIISKGVGVSRTNGDENLRVVSRSNTGAGVALSVFTSVLSGGLNALAFKKENLHGTTVESIKHPVFVNLKTQVESMVDNYLDNLATSKPPQFKHPIILEGNQLLLVYSNLTGDTTGFELRAVATMIKKAESAGFFTGPKSINCSYSTPETEALALEKWEENNYALVKQRLVTFESDCNKQFSEKLNSLLTD